MHVETTPAPDWVQRVGESELDWQLRLNRLCRPAPRCPDCNRVMSGREAAEQGSCNDCYGDAGYSSPADLGEPFE